MDKTQSKAEPKEYTVNLRNAPELEHIFTAFGKPTSNVQYESDGEAKCFRRIGGRWHCSSGPAIITSAGEQYYIHGNTVEASLLPVWQKYARFSNVDADDPSLATKLMNESKIGETFPATLLRICEP